MEMKGSHGRRVGMGRAESQGGNEQQPVGRHPASSKHSYFRLIGFGVGGDELTRTPKRQRKRRGGIWGCGGERGERDAVERRAAKGRGAGARWVAKTSARERIIKNHGCLSAAKPPLPLLCQTGSSR